MSLIIVHREVETTTTEFQEVYFTTADINALFPYHSFNEVCDIVRMKDHPDNQWITDRILNDHHKNLQGTLIDLSEHKSVKSARIDIL